MMKKTNGLLKTAGLVVLLIVLLNPGMNPLLGEGVKNAAAMQPHFFLRFHNIFLNFSYFSLFHTSSLI